MNRSMLAGVLCGALMSSPAFAQQSPSPYDELRREISALSDRVQKLEAENVALKERNDRLERMLPAQVPPAVPVDTTPAPAAETKPAPQPWYESLKLSGYVFGDAYAVLENHDPAVEDQTGFWIRRGYLTLDSTIADAWSARLRFEFNSPGDFKTNSKLDPFVKDAYLAWKSGGKELYLGLSPSPTFDLVENFWGYRPIEKTPLDLYRMGSSRDFGVSFKGRALGDKAAYHVMFGNGAGDGAETNEGKKAMLSLSLRPTDALVFEIYGDFEDRPDSTDRTTYQGFAGWKGERSRYGLQYAWQDREATTGPGESVSVASLFGIWDVSGKSSLIARYDRSFDGYPDADRIPYLPIANDTEFDLAILGWDYRLRRQISLMPNIEYVLYRATDGVPAPDDDLYGKLTLYYQF
jgi:hypothetical protein